LAISIKFDTGKAEVKPEYDDQLKKVADFLKTYPDASAEIEGHTDNRGTAVSNRALSQRRAESVRQALIDRFGADASRLTAKGYGPDKPIADNSTPEGRAQNRRVVATFTAIKKAPPPSKPAGH
jgi:OOP family OmpA-OmpF porin